MGYFMKKRLLSILLVVLLLVQLVPATVIAYPVPELGAQDGVTKFATGVPMGVAHRAAWRMAPENSLLAVAASISMGIDVAELDVKMTKDGVLVLSHDGSIDRCAMGSGNISDYNWEQLKTIAVKPGQGGSSAYLLTEDDAALLNSLPNYAEHSGTAVAGQTIPLSRMDDLIDLLKKLGPNTMVNLDHCFSQELFTSCYVLFREQGMLNRFFFKNSNDVWTMNQWYAAAAEKWNKKHSDEPITAKDVQESILYVYIIRSADYGILQSHLDNGDKLVMVEICISDDPSDKVIHEKLEPWCLENKVAMFVNTMWSGLCSTKPDTEATWAEMLNRGYKAIQTDRPSELAGYLAAYNRDRSAQSVIEAEHFHGFNYGTQGFSVPAAADSRLNKKVEKLTAGDYLEYRRIVFDGTETLLNLTMQGLSGGTLGVYLDGLAEENRIAQLTFASSEDYRTVTAVLDKTPETGTHTVHLRFTGAPKQVLASLDSFRFVSAACFTDAQLEELQITTTAGTAPVLPGSVQVTANGETYGLEVRWEQVAASSYAKEGQFLVLGYVPALGCYAKALVTVTATSVVKPEITTDGLALWMDASEGVTAENGAVSAWASKVGNITATVKSGSPTVKGKGIAFDGDDSMDLVLPENFWNGKSEFTVLLYNSSENITAGASNGTSSQYHSVLYFGETESWGSAYFNASQNEVIWRFGSGTSGDYGTTYTRPLNIGSLFTSTAIRKNGLRDTLFVNGEKVYTGTAAAEQSKNIKSEGWIGLGKNGNYFKGTINEILIYDRALADDEITAAQLALAEKYADKVSAVEAVAVTCEAGTAPVLPKTVKITYESGASIDLGVQWERINPNDYLEEGSFPVKGTLADGTPVVATVTVTAKSVKEPVTTRGLMFWLNASEGVSTDDSGVVTQWKSKVGDAVATKKKGDAKLTQNAVNGKPAVTFDGSEDVLQMVLENGALNGLEGVTVVTYAASRTPWKQTNNSFDWNVQRHTLFSADESGSWGSFYTGIYSDAISARFGTGTTNDNGFRAERSESTEGFTATSIRWNGSTKTYDVQVGGEQFGTGVSLGSKTANNKNIFYFGTGKGNTYWTGDVCDILVYDRVLTDEELADVNEYLRDLYEPKDKTVSTDGLIFWLDASEGVEQDASGKVTKWDSRTGSVSAINKKGTLTVKENVSNGKPGVYFSGNGDVMQMVLADGRLNGLTGATVIAYASPETSWKYNEGKSLAWNVQRRALFYVDEAGSWGSFFASVYTDAVAARFGTGTANDYGFSAARSSETSAYGATAIRWDGTTYEATVDGEAFGTGTSKSNVTKNNKNIVYFGTGKENTYWKGTLCEVLVYDRALTDAELENVYNYLDDKYTEKTEPEIHVTGVYLKEEGEQLTLHRGESWELTAAAVPANAVDTGLTFATSDPKVVTVDENGKITATGLGYATVIVTTKDGDYSAWCGVSVERTEAEKLWQNIQDIVTWAGKQNPAAYANWDEMQRALDAVRTLSEASSLEELTPGYQALREAMLGLLEKVDYRFTSETSDQTLEAGAALELEIVPTSEHFLNVQVDGPPLEQSAYTLETVNDGLKLTLKPEYMATLGLGSHTVKALFANGEAATGFTLIRSVEGVTLEPQAAELTVGEILTVNAVVQPADATNANVSFTSSAPAVATVDENGVVTALKPGQAVITVTTADGGFTASCALTVKDAPCRHEHTTRENEQKPTCTRDGYSGDLVCKDCGQTLEKGETLPKTGHKYVNGVCSVCGRKFGAPTTADGFALPLTLAAAIVSLIALAILMLVRKRKDTV